MRSATPTQLVTARGLLVVMLACVIALRSIAAPALVAADDPGVMTICSGGKIYYVTLDGTPVDPGTSKSEPCIYDGVPFDVVALSAPDAGRSLKPQMVTRPLSALAQILAKRARQNTTRAPPFLSQTL